MTRGNRLTLEAINGLSREEFVRVVGPVFERSPWIAEETWAKRPFGDLEVLHRALSETVAGTSEEKQVELIRAHPDLVGRAALAVTMTKESQGEQTAAGLNQLSVSEIRTFQENNETYRNKFGFPFVICARLNRKEAILEGFRTRLNHTRDQEIETAIEEIGKIAWLRLRDLVSD